MAPAHIVHGSSVTESTLSSTRPEPTAVAAWRNSGRVRGVATDTAVTMSISPRSFLALAAMLAGGALAPAGAAAAGPDAQILVRSAPGDRAPALRAAVTHAGARVVGSAPGHR